MIKLLSAFFAFGAIMCALTIVLLLFPGTPLDSLWRFNPDAHSAFSSIRPAALLLMLVVGTGCGFAAVGLWRKTLAGIWVALTILSLKYRRRPVQCFSPTRLPLLDRRTCRWRHDRLLGPLSKGSSYIFALSSRIEGPTNSVKNYMSDKIGAADSGIITIDQPAGLARENII
jgi:hypothetical protein